MVVVSTPNFDSAYRIFTVLNDRGLDLEDSDILKPEIIDNIPANQQDLYTNKWEEIEDELGRKKFQELFAHIRMIKVKAKLRGTNVKEIRERVKPKENPIDFIDNQLLKLGEALQIIESCAYESAVNPDEVNQYLRWLNRIDNFDWLPPALLYYSKHSNDEPKLVSFFKGLERLAASMMIRRADVNLD